MVLLDSTSTTSFPSRRCCHVLPCAHNWGMGLFTLLHVSTHALWSTSCGFCIPPAHLLTLQYIHLQEGNGMHLLGLHERHGSVVEGISSQSLTSSFHEPALRIRHLLLVLLLHCSQGGGNGVSNCQVLQVGLLVHILGSLA